MGEGWGFCPSYAAAYADSPGSGVLAAWASVEVGAEGGVGVGVVEVVVVVAAAAVIGQSPLVVVIGPGAASSSAASDHRHERLRAAPPEGCGRPASLWSADSLKIFWVGPHLESQAWSPKPQPKASRLLSCAPWGHHLLLVAILVFVLAFHVGEVLDERQRDRIEDGVLLMRENRTTTSEFVCMFDT